jgi:hypothetical protein
MVATLAVSASVSAKTLECTYLGYNAVKLGFMQAKFNDEDLRDIHAVVGYQEWNENESRNVSTHRYAFFDSIITTLLVEPQKKMIFALDNKKVSEIVSMHYDAYNDQFIGTRAAHWKNNTSEEYETLALCKLN